MRPRVDRHNVLSTYSSIEVDADRDKLNRRLSNYVDHTYDGQYMTLTVHLCVQKLHVARAHLQQLILEQGEVDKSVRCSCTIFSGLNVP